MQRSVQPAVQAPQTWLPDASLDAHPTGTWLLVLGFDLYIRSFYRREILFPDTTPIPPGTLIVANHQRDIDGPMLGTVLTKRRGLRFQWPLPFYATREDLFRPGILSRLTVHWPRPVSALLGHVSLAWFFPLGRAEPMRRLREFTLGETLQALVDAGCGDEDLASLLNARGRRELGVVPGRLTTRVAASRTDGALEAWWGLRRLTLPALEKIAPAFHSAIDAQLKHFARRLDRGRRVYFSPEGTISTDGHFGRIRAGCFRLARLTAEPPWIQPMGLSYDTLAAGRSRVVIQVGPPLRADTNAPRRDFDARLRHAILSLTATTPSHLIAHYLLHGPTTFQTLEFTDWLTRSRAALQARRIALDPLFARLPTAELARRRLRWLEQKRLVVREGGRFHNTCQRDAPPGWHHTANIVRYLGSGLEDLVPDLDRVLPC